jgi:signal transduction histidine kinase
MVVSAKNITELKEKERLLIEQSKMAQMGEMLNMIAHQWRQPLNATSGAAINLSIKNELDMATKEDIEETTTFIEAQAQKMSKTINDFMEFNRSESNREFSLQEAVQKVEDIISSQLKNRNIVLVIDIPQELYVYHNAKAIEHAVLNLVSNARDAFEESKELEKKEIKVYTKEDSEYISICVEDNAGGISEDILDKVFNPYFTTKDQGKGTGIGLYMSKQMIESVSGASIDVSNGSMGALFCIKIKKGVS